MLYNKRFQAKPLNTARHFALALGNGPDGYKDVLEPPPLDHLGYNKDHINRLKPPADGKRYPLSGLMALDWGDKAQPKGGVRRVSLNCLTKPTTTFSQQLGKNALQLSFVDGPKGFDAYYLPWDENGGAVYMQLGDDADFFFTASLSGCSIMVSGEPDQPTVYHCGVGGWGDTRPYWVEYHNPTPKGVQSVELWEDLVAYLTGKDAPPDERIDTTYYLNDRTPGQPFTTEDSRRMEIALRGVMHDPQAQATPWGAVFGRRRDDGWRFYLQQNVTLNYQMAGKPISQMRPLAVTRFYPDWQNYTRQWGWKDL